MFQIHNLDGTLDDSGAGIGSLPPLAGIVVAISGDGGGGGAFYPSPPNGRERPLADAFAEPVMSRARGPRL